MSYFNILTDAKKNMKQVEMEQGLYAKVVILCRKDLKVTKENGKKQACSAGLQGNTWTWEAD